jgi:hypothetical protein
MPHRFGVDVSGICTTGSIYKGEPAIPDRRRVTSYTTCSELHGGIRTRISGT